ncbi:hypothetical protein ABK040_013744 [Willaertia magna]
MCALSLPNKPKILLHFDVNKTLIINDSAAGKSMDDLIAQIIMSSIWGHVHNLENETTSFELLSFNLSSSKPNSVTTSNNLPLVNYYDYIERYLHPYPDYPEDTSLEIRKHTNRKIKERRTGCVKNFLKTDFGKQFAKEAEEMKNCLKCKNGEGFVNIVPAFFELLLELYRRQRDFEIILRTFGTLDDISSVVEEINLFCEGNHRQFPLTEEEVKFFRSKKISIKREGVRGYMYRNCNTTCNLILNSLQFKKEMLDFKPINEMKFEKNEIVLHGLDNVYHNIIATNQSRIIRDFYYWWHVNNECCIGGKVFLVDVEEKNIFQIFFDDNVCVNPKFPVKGIIDLRNAKTGESLDQEKYLGIFTVNAYALDFIKNQQYYIQELGKAEQLWQNL